MDEDLHSTPASYGNAVAFTGLAGTGKTTLLRQMAGSLPDSALVSIGVPNGGMGEVWDVQARLPSRGNRQFFYENTTLLLDLVS